MKPIVFNDPALTESFERDGYVLLPGLDARTVAELRAEYASFCPHSVSKMYSNVHDLPLETNELIAERLRAVLSPILQDCIQGYDIRGGTFLVKGRGEESACQLHQDWNSTDETEQLALVAWIPLCDVDEANGCLVVAPGTHHPEMFPTVRGANVGDAHFELTDELLEHCIPVPMHQGEICLFAQNLFHGSLPNHSHEDRVALYSTLLPAGTPMLHFLRDVDGTVRQIEIDNSFYYGGEAGEWLQGSATRQLRTEPQVSRQRGEVKLDEFLEVMRGHQAQPLPSGSKRRRLLAWWRRD